MAKKYALLIGTDQYEDPGFEPLTVPRADVESLQSVLNDPQIGGFDQVDAVLNGSLTEIMAAIGELFGDKSKDDLLLLYFSGHGALDVSGQLHLSVAKTKPKRLSTTALSSTLIKSEMNNSHSRRQVLILDCCYAGAFSRNAAGSKSAINETVVNEATFDVKGYGREILVSSSATQRSWEGNRIIGSSDKSLFTHFLVQGLQAGEAAPEGESEITVAQLYDYVHDKVVSASPAMTPQRWVEAQTDSIVLALNPNPVVKTTPLSEDILISLKDDRPHVREGAVRELGRLASGEDRQRAQAVFEVLQNRRALERDIYVMEAIDAVLNVEIVASKEPKVAVISDTAPDGPPSQRSGIGIYLAGTFLLVGLVFAYFKMQTEPPMELVTQVRDEEDKLAKRIAKPSPLKSASSPKRQPGTVFQETLKDGSKSPEMVVIPTGSFLMGSPNDEPGRSGDEGPQHIVNITEPFAIGRYEVTVGQFRKFNKATGYRTDAEKGDGCFTYAGEWKKIKNANWDSPQFEQNDRHPVVCVSWTDTKAYIDWLNAETSGKPFRLPSESEWEYTVRAESDTSRPWGTKSSATCKYANVADNTLKQTLPEWPYSIHDCFDGYVYTAPVDTFTKNKFGLYNLIGNAWEWVQDTWHENYKSAPTDGSAWVDIDSELRVLRGGSWNIKPDSARSAIRDGGNPADSGSVVGFRLAQDI